MCDEIRLMVRRLQLDEGSTGEKNGKPIFGTKMKMIHAALVAGPLAISLSATRPAQALVVIGGGLVNLQIVDVIDDINVNLGVAMQICGVTVGVIARDVQDGIATYDRVLSGLL